MKKIVSFLVLGATVFLASCNGSDEASELENISLEYSPVEFSETEVIADLVVSFTDDRWDGLTVPEGQQCSMFDGNGSSPELLVENIPEAANALILSFNDRTFKANDDGGHGIVGYWLYKVEDNVLVPSLAGESNDLPEGMFVVEKFRSNRGSEGVYLPPCSGGNGNEYYITVKAVYVGQTPEETSLLLGEGEIEMGIY